jgi:hypothetical protein
MRGDVALDIKGEVESDSKGEALSIKGETALDVMLDMLPVLASIEEMTGDAPPTLAKDEIALLSIGENPPLTATPTTDSAVPTETVVQGNSDASMSGGDENSCPSRTGVSTVVVVVDTEG